MDDKRPTWITEHLPEELANSTLFKFKIKIDNQIVSVDMTMDLEVDYENLERQLADVPSIYAYFAALYSETRSNVAVAERKVKAYRGQLTEETARQASQNGIKLGVDAIKMVVEADQKLNELEAKLIVAQKYAGKLFHTVEAIKLKFDSLRSLAGFKRQEYSSS